MIRSLLERSKITLFEHEDAATTGVGVLSGMVVPPQDLAQWCWAAVTAGVASFYAGGTAVDKCEIVEVNLNVSGCCQEDPDVACNQPFFLEDSLTTAGHLAREVDGPSTFAQVAQEIDAQRPLCARIESASQGAHFVCLAGYSANGQYVLVLDPAAAGSGTWLRIGDFTTKYGYGGSGRWTNSYFTTG